MGRKKGTRWIGTYSSLERARKAAGRIRQRGKIPIIVTTKKYVSAGDDWAVRKTYIVYQRHKK